MECKLEQHAAFSIVGKKYRVSAGEEHLAEIPQLWAELSSEITTQILVQMDGQPAGLLGVCGAMKKEGFDYYIAVASTKPVPEGMARLEIPAAAWAIFESIGPMPGAIQEVWQYIYQEWLPTSGYALAQDMPALEVYSDGDTSASDYHCEAWLPVTQK